jgi:hypothetical protein
VTFRNRTIRLSLGIGAAAAARTAILFAIVGRVQRTGLPIIDDVLWMGVRIALLPFGGVIETGLPTWQKVCVGVLFNGVLWSALGLAGVALYRRRQVVTCALNGH